MSALLDLDGVTIRYGENVVLSGVTLSVDGGEIVGLLGPNGSGKSTALNAITGFAPLAAGAIRFDGQRIDALSPHRIARLGVRRTFQLPSMPARMSVLELAMAASSVRHGIAAALWRGRATRALEADTRARAAALLDELKLSGVAHLCAASISGGQKKLLGIACAMMTEPKLLLLDEPTAGVHPNLRGELIDELRRIRQQGVTLVVIEHDMHFIRELCDRCVVLDRGVTIANCRPAELERNRRVLDAYLGRAHAAPRPLEAS
ncbi:ABC transporter ATP-binding protein [Burkholderia sp. AU28863]|uniref:ABC transporter ATP-binding protein n=1 Tax=Burkholderia sp. AU28863 TaxID=2015352 RepID=UPI000B7A7D38|nr:ABC transporter ATP-binding protein [Burkholderia sp. AU28863]OXI64636.1 ABC transporter ATP-binding protein [Burkholderia sp. AU28863]